MDGRMDVIRAGNDEQPLLYNRNRVRTKTAVYPKARKKRVRGASCKKNAVPADGLECRPAQRGLRVNAAMAVAQDTYCPIMNVNV